MEAETQKRKLKFRY